LGIEFPALRPTKLEQSHILPSSLAAISSIHKLNQFTDPTQNANVKIELRRMHRTLGRYSKQAFGITAPIPEKILGQQTIRYGVYAIERCHY